MDNLFEEFAQLLNAVPMDDLNPMDQLTVLAAYTELIQKVKPIYEKYAWKGDTKKTFLMRIHEEGE